MKDKNEKFKADIIFNDQNRIFQYINNGEKLYIMVKEWNFYSCEHDKSD